MFPQTAFASPLAIPRPLTSPYQPAITYHSRRHAVRAVAEPPAHTTPGNSPIPPGNASASSNTSPGTAPSVYASSTAAAGQTAIPNSTAEAPVIPAVPAVPVTYGQSATDRRRGGYNPDALLTFGLPKGSLLKPTLELMSRAGWNIHAEDRSYFAKVNDEDLNMLMFRSQEMARYVGMGSVDCGICGFDWVLENNMGDNVVDVASLNYSKNSDGSVRWVLAVPEDSPVTRPEQLAGGVISTELVRITRNYFEQRGIPDVNCEFSWGATEVKARARLVDAICDVTETGDSIRANRLRIIDTVMESSTRVIANAEAWRDPARRAKIEEIVMLLDGALKARRRVGLKMNVPVGSVDAARKVLEEFAVTSPTVAPLADDHYVSMEIITERSSERLAIPQLKALGCLGIFSYNLNTLVA